MPTAPWAAIAGAGVWSVRLFPPARRRLFAVPVAASPVLPRWKAANRLPPRLGGVMELTHLKRSLLYFSRMAGSAEPLLVRYTR